jgi:subtilisin family serine protease
MKHLKLIKSILTGLLISITVQTIAQDQDYYYDPVVRDSEGNPLYFKNQMIVKFHPDLVNKAVIDNKEIQYGLVSEFINPIALQMIIDSGYFHEGIANLNIWKIHQNMTTSDTLTITRIGETMEIPKFWSTFLIEYDGSIEGISLEQAIDTLNLLWPIVEYAHLNYVAMLTVLPNDNRFVAGDQAGLHPTGAIPNENINCDPAWDLTVGRDNISIGIYDTGINWDHDDYSEDGTNSWNASRVKGGWDWIFNRHPSVTTTADDNGHGSACAGIIGAIRNNDRGVAGVAGGNGAINQWGVRLYSMKLFNSFGRYASVSNLTDAITEGATSFNGTYGYSLNVMNCSWFLRQSDVNALKDAIRYAYRNNVVMAFASGNTGDNTAQYPSSYRDEWVLKVGANDASGNRASFSTTGNNLDFIAPGTPDIYRTTDALNNSTYNYNQDGTSFAAPHVAGAAGLMLSYINAPSNAPNNLAPDDVENLLQRFARDIDAPGYDNNTGFGIIDIGATIQGIRMPRFEARHYSQNFNNSSATLISTNVQITVVQGGNGVAAGTYFGDVYEVTQNFNISQPAGRAIIDVWKRNSSSTLYGNLPVIAEANCEVISWNQNTAVMRGYIFDIKTNILGQAVNKWLPSHGLSGTGTMALTVYSENPTATSVVKIPIDQNFARVVPNPSNGNVSLMFTLLKPTNLGVQITDLTGKIVFSKEMSWETDGHKNIDMDLQYLKSGIYFCNIQTDEGVISKKISIVR